MIFSSPIFLFLFLPTTLVVYLCLPARARNAFLLVASLVFYAWGETFYVALMLASITLNHFVGLGLGHLRGTSRRAALLTAICLNLGLLSVFKYGNYFADNLNVLLSSIGMSPIVVPLIHLPIGISFFTFQALSYVIDIYRGEARSQRSLINTGLYISLFPQLIAGPIVRYGSIAEQLLERTLNLEGFSAGVQRFILGLAKKVLIANQVALVVDRIAALPTASLTPGAAWLGVFCFAMQIYFDFSGYSDMAIGLGQMLGFRFPENFNHPYTAQSMQEFWRRWHISLSTWFRDYLYVPLGGNRKGVRRTYCNLWIVFFLCGLWHGASWNFVIWGLLHGTFLVVERLGLARLLPLLWRPLRHAYVAFVVLLTWVFFWRETLPDTRSYLAAMFGLGRGGEVSHDVVVFLNFRICLVIAAAALWSTPLLERAMRRLERTWRQNENLMFRLALGGHRTVTALGLLLLFGLSVMHIAAGAYNPFIYFRF